ncbi:MAG: 3-hydroxyacyl-ACP dehydratase FabZ family protein [Acidiferrobacterales bacterium]
MNCLSANAPDYATPIASIDEVTRLDETGITVRKKVKGDEEFFRGHYPGSALYPGIFIIEAVNQASQYYGRSYGKKLSLVEVCKARFLAPVRPETVLEFDCHCNTDAEQKQLLVKATCRCSAAVTAEIKLLFRWRDA